MNIDLKDKRIIAELDMNARMPISELAKKLRMSRDVTAYRINRLKKEKIVYGILPVFDSAVVGLFWYRLLIRLTNVNTTVKKEFLEEMKQNKFIIWVGEVGGNWDFVINFMARNNQQFNIIFQNILKKFGKNILDYEILVYIDVKDFERSYVIENNKSRKELNHAMVHDSSIVLDELDKKIIKELKHDGGSSYLELGQRLKVSNNTIKNRIESMQKNKIILGFRLWLNPQLYNYKSHMLFLEIHKFNLEEEKKLAEYAKTIPNIIFFVKHMGKWRIGMEIETKDDREFQMIFNDIRSKFSSIITGFESFPLFEDHVINYFPDGDWL